MADYMYKVLSVYFNEKDEEQMAVYNKLREMEFKREIRDKSSYVRSLITKAVKNK